MRSGIDCVSEVIVVNQLRRMSELISQQQEFGGVGVCTRLGIMFGVQVLVAKQGGQGEWTT